MKLPKYAIVYDPYSSLIKYVQSRRHNVNSMYRKIVYLKNSTD